MLPLEALRDALAGWRKTKNPRFAAIAQWATARALATEAPRPLVGDSGKKADAAAWLALLDAGDPLDVPRLVATIGGGTSAMAADRITLLSKLSDPRVFSGLLDLLGAPPYRARTALPFFRACAKALEESGDPRVRSALEDLSQRYKSIVETAVGDDIAALLRRTAASIDQVKPGPLPAAQEKKCATLEAMFEAEQAQTKRGAARQQSAQHDDEALLAAIYAAPDDDTPRHVFADALSERGDVRGEFIALQLTRAKGQSTPAQMERERQLADDPKRRAAWSLPLSQGGECNVRRGFPDQMLVESRSLKTIVGNPAVRTLSGAAGFERNVSIKQAKAFLQHPVAAGIRRVNGLTPELLDALEGPLSWHTAGLLFVPSAAQLSRLPQLRELSVTTWGNQAELTEQTFAAARQLTQLTLGMNRVFSGALLAPLTELSELHVPGWLENFAWAKELAHLPKLERLHLGSGALGASLEGLRLKVLGCSLTTAFDADALLRALPQLEELRVENRGTVAVTGMRELLATDRLRQLRFASMGSYHFLRPFTPEGVLELRAWNQMDFARYGEAFALLPEGCVAKVRVRPRTDDPWAPLGTPPSGAMEALQAQSKVPVELAWY